MTFLSSNNFFFFQNTQGGDSTSNEMCLDFFVLLSADGEQLEFLQQHTLRASVQIHQTALVSGGSNLALLINSSKHTVEFRL